MKSPKFSPLSAQILKVVGIILILSSFIDYGLLLGFPPAGFLDKQWQLSLTTQFVDRGVIPLVGLVFMFTGFWVDSTTTGQSNTGLKLGALVLSSILGAFFLLIVPVLHYNNTTQVTRTTLEEVKRQAEQAEKQVDSQLQQQQTQVRDFLQDEQKQNQLAQAIRSGQVSGPQLEQLRNLQESIQRFKQNPAAIDEQAKTARNQVLIQVRERRQQLEQQTQKNALKSTIGTISSSILLALGYIFIGWTGLRDLGVQSGPRGAAGR